MVVGQSFNNAKLGVKMPRWAIPVISFALAVLLPQTLLAQEVYPPGVDKEIHEAIQRGLSWLSRNQGNDGSWRNSGGYGSYPAAMTGLAGMAFIAGGSTPTRGQYWREVRVVGSSEELNQELEKAGRVADFLEFAELMCRDALHREESCGGHYREEYKTPDGEAKRNDDKFCYVAAWEWNGVGKAPTLNKEPLTFETVHLTQRSYK